MTEHKHRYVLVVEDNQTEMVCECGKYLKSIYKGAALVDYEVEEIKRSSDGAVLYVKEESHIVKEDANDLGTHDGPVQK